MKIVKVLVKLQFPENYTDMDITSIMENCDYAFNYPVEEGDDEVTPIESEINDLDID